VCSPRASICLAKKLIGAAVVGVGIPQPSFEREVLRAMTEDDEGEGFRVAYVYPGIERVLQAAGRVIRTETDRGVVLLLAERYQAPEYRRLLPRFWRVRPAADPTAAAGMLHAFWAGENINAPGGHCKAARRRFLFLEGQSRSGVSAASPQHLDGTAHAGQISM
jgi:hypothetical protein